MEAVSGDFSLLKRAYFYSVMAMIPIAYPSLPFNTILFDYVNAAFILVLSVLLFMRRYRVGIYLGTPFLVILVGSLISMYDSQDVSTNLKSLAQDAYLFLFLSILHNLIENDGDIRILTRWWLLLAIIESGIAIPSVIFHFSLVPSSTAQVPDLTRAQGTFLDCNSLSSYLGMSFFLVFNPFFKISPLSRCALGALIASGMISSKSMSAALGFLAGNLIIVVVYWAKARLVQRIKLVAGLAAIGLLAFFLVLPQLLSSENFVNRAPKSAGSRLAIWKAGYETYRDHPLGIGPGSFKSAGHGPFNKEGTRAELHNDYLGFLVERGTIGFIGYLSWLGTMAWMLRYSIKGAKSEQELSWALALTGMFIFNLVDSFHHEGMHYRHVWVVFALIVAQYRITKRQSGVSFRPAATLAYANPY
jgi:O-antigen ligase